MSRKRGPGRARSVRITEARPGLTEDVRDRQRRYLVAMLVRTACVVLMVVLWDDHRTTAVVALVGAAVIPYAAVVITTGGRRREKRVPFALVGPPSGPVLEPTMILPPGPAREPAAGPAAGASRC